MADRKWETLKVQGPENSGVAILTLNCPKRFNALTLSFFKELPLAIASLDFDPAVRVVILKAAGPHFCSGIDLSTFADITAGKKGQPSTQVCGACGAEVENECLGREKEIFWRDLKDMQAAFTAFEECRKPIIAAVHGACIGGGIDMITACDLRYCTQDASFSVKEVDLAITADLGTLQRLPKLVGQGTSMELALTGRKFNGTEAKSVGLVQGVFPTKAELDLKVMNVAKEIAAKSPLAVMGTKAVLIKSRDLTVAQGLEYVALWNSAMLVSQDLKEAMQAHFQKRKPHFSKL